MKKIKHREDERDREEKTSLFIFVFNDNGRYSSNNRLLIESVLYYCFPIRT